MALLRLWRASSSVLTAFSQPFRKRWRHGNLQLPWTEEINNETSEINFVYLVWQAGRFKRKGHRACDSHCQREEWWSNDVIVSWWAGRQPSKKWKYGNWPLRSSLTFPVKVTITPDLQIMARPRWRLAKHRLAMFMVGCLIGDTPAVSSRPPIGR